MAYKKCWHQYKVTSKDALFVWISIDVHWSDWTKDMSLHAKQPPVYKEALE